MFAPPSLLALLGGYCRAGLAVLGDADVRTELRATFLTSLDVLALTFDLGRRSLAPRACCGRVLEPVVS